MNLQGAEIWFVHIGIKIQELSRVAFSIFGFDVYWYGLIIGIGIFAGFGAAYLEAKRTGQNTEDYSDFMFITIITSIIGARLYYVLFAWDTFKDDLLSVFNIRSGGLAIYGGVIAAVITGYFYTKIRHINFLKFADTGVIGLILGQAIGRWGNFFNKEAYGSFTDNFFAMAIRADVASNPKQELLDKAVIIDGTKYIQVHPTFFYESMWNLAVFVFLNIYIRKFKKTDGEVFALYFFCYGVGRFFIEGLRTDQLIFFNTGIAISQFLSLIFIFVSIFFIFINRRKWAKKQKD